MLSRCLTHHSMFVVLKSISFISSTIVHVIHFIDHSASLSYLPYLVILMWHCHSDFHSRLRNKILPKYIHSCADIKTYSSKPNFTNITWCQKRDSGESRWAVSTLEASIMVVNHQSSLSTKQQQSTNRWTNSIYQTLLPFMGTLGNIGNVRNKN